MSTITKEQLIEDLKASTQNSSGMFEIGEETICALMSLLTAPPAPVSVPDYPDILPCPVILEPGLRFGKGVKTITVLEALKRRAEYYAELEAMTPEQRAHHEAGMKEFAAMLQGVENAESTTTMQPAPSLDSSPKIAESPSGNSPVIPDGWVACSVRMPDEYNFDIWVFSPSLGVQDGVQWDGLEFADDEYQFRIKDVSHWMKKIYPAAPQKEVK